MEPVQLELNVENKNKDDLQIYFLQQQIDALHMSMGKVRRSLFSQIGELKKSYAQLVDENNILKSKLKELKNEKIEWIYGENGTLFDVREDKAVGC